MSSNPSTTQADHGSVKSLYISAPKPSLNSRSKPSPSASSAPQEPGPSSQYRSSHGLSSPPGETPPPPLEPPEAGIHPRDPSEPQDPVKTQPQPQPQPQTANNPPPLPTPAPAPPPPSPPRLSFTLSRYLNSATHPTPSYLFTQPTVTGAGAGTGTGTVAGAGAGVVGSQVRRRALYELCEDLERRIDVGPRRGGVRERMGRREGGSK